MIMPQNTEFKKMVHVLMLACGQITKRIKTQSLLKNRTCRQQRVLSLLKGTLSVSDDYIKPLMRLTEEQTKELFRAVHYFFPQRKITAYDLHW